MEEIIQDDHDDTCNIKKKRIIEQIFFLLDQLNERFDRLEARVKNLENHSNISEECTSNQVDDSIGVIKLVMNNLDNIDNKSQLEISQQSNEDIIKEDCEVMDNNLEHIDTTYLVSTLIDLKLFEQFDQSHPSNIIYTIDRISYQRYKFGTIPFNVDTIPDIDSVLFTAYSSQFKIWDPGLRAA